MKSIGVVLLLSVLAISQAFAGVWVKSTGWPAEGERKVVRTMVRVNAGLYIAAGNPYSENGTVLYQSTDRGVSWSKINHNLHSACTINQLLANENILFASTNLGLFKSDDNGKAWKAVSNLRFPSNGLLKQGSSLYLATNNGMFVTIDGFESFTKLDNFDGITSDTGTWCVSEMNGKIYTATVAGPWVLQNSVWKSCGNIPNTKNFHISKMVYSQGRYYLITFGNSFYSSTDAMNWEKFDSPFTAHNIYALSDRVLLSLNTGGFFQCRDGGTAMVAFFNSGLKAGILYNSIQEFDGYILLGGYGEQGGSGIYRRALSDMNIPTPALDFEFSLKVTVYPNPCKNELFFNSMEVQSNIKIMDIQGRKVLEMAFGMETLKVDVSALKPGIYLAEITSTRESKVIKFVKE